MRRTKREEGRWRGKGMRKTETRSDKTCKLILLPLFIKKFEWERGIVVENGRK